MTVDNWINLVTALGTLAAVFVAIWLAYSATRRAREDAMVGAKLAAAGIIARLSTTLDTVGSIRLQCDFMNVNVHPDVSRIQALAAVRARLDSGYYQPDAATLMALTPLPSNSAHRIASAFDYLDRVKLQMASLGQGLISDLTTPDQREQLLHQWGADISSAHELLQVALRACVAARNLGAPLPSGEELYGNEP